GNWIGGVPDASTVVHINNAGTAQISSPGAEAYAFFIGNSGPNGGALEIGANGTLASREGSSIGVNSSATGKVTVNGGSWTNGGPLSVGVRGHGTLEMSGGTVSNRMAYIGDYSGSTGIAKISGGQWTSTYLNIGNQGSGTLEI